MSWVTRLEQQIIIRTGDGLEYFPQWLNAAYEQEYNFNIFNYIDVDGSQVQRNAARSRRFPIEIYFIGEDHIDVSERFRISAADRRPWTIFHPFYDEISVHPIRLRFDNTKYNITQITGQVVETIEDEFPRQTDDVTEQIVLQKETLDIASADAYATQTSELQPSETNEISESIDQIESNGNTVLPDEEDQVTFRNRVLDARRDLNNILTQPITTLRSIQGAINFPALVAASVRARIDNLIEAFDRVVQSISNVPNLSRNRKVYAESSGAAIVSAMTIAATTNTGTQTRGEVQEIIDDILATYTNYRSILDGFETATQTQVDAYAADAVTQNDLVRLLFLTLSNLQDVSLDSQQEITIINETPNNAILLTHRVYGLDEQDENLNRFIETNNIGLNELLEIPKGRELLYYV